MSLFWLLVFSCPFTFLGGYITFLFLANLFKKSPLPHVIIDIDCLTAWEEAIIKILLDSSLESNKNYSDRQQRIRSLILDRPSFELPQEVLKAIFQPLRKAGFYFGLRPILPAIQAVQEMIKQGYKVTFVSSPNLTDNYENERRKWILKYFPDFQTDDIIFARDKSILLGNYSVQGNHKVYLIHANPEESRRGYFYPKWVQITPPSASYNRNCGFQNVGPNWREWRKVIR